MFIGMSFIQSNWLLSIGSKCETKYPVLLLRIITSSKLWSNKPNSLAQSLVIKRKCNFPVITGIAGLQDGNWIELLYHWVVPMDVCQGQSIDYSSFIPGLHHVFRCLRQCWNFLHTSMNLLVSLGGRRRGCGYLDRTASLLIAVHDPPPGY